MTDTPQKWVDCPTCKGKSLFAQSNVFRPFCCERCKNVDFGAWASASFSLPTDAPPDDLVFGDARLQ